MKSASNDNNNSKHNMAIPDNNDLLSLLMQNQEKNYITSEKQIGNSKVLQPPKGQLSENCFCPSQ